MMTPDAVFRDAASVRLWIFIVLAMLGVIVGGPRSIALATLVTVFFEPDRRDRANGLVGTATGVTILVTSVISGVLVAAGGMLYVLLADDRHPAARLRASGDPDRRGPTSGPRRGRTRSGRSRPHRCRSARHFPPGPRRPRPAGPDRVLLLQQLPRRRLHGPDGRLRPVAGLGPVVGPAVGRAQRRVHHRRAGGGQDRTGQQPAADPAAGQSGVLDGHHDLSRSAPRSSC